MTSNINPQNIKKIKFKDDNVQFIRENLVQFKFGYESNKITNENCKKLKLLLINTFLNTDKEYNKILVCPNKILQMSVLLKTYY